MILEIIKEKGFYWYVPKEWSDDNESELSKLIEENIIETVKDASITDFMNCDYCYVLKGNPDKVHVVQDNNYTWLEKSKS